jgi:hypothetical protein
LQCTDRPYRSIKRPDKVSQTKHLMAGQKRKE